jgi:hypothetical protein
MAALINNYVQNGGKNRVKQLLGEQGEENLVIDIESNQRLHLGKLKVKVDEKTTKLPV